MTLTVNGQSRSIPDGSTLTDLLESLGLKGQPCAAEVNKSVVPSRNHDTTRLEDGDAIELVTLVGGG
jgi:sulfur carrier protein